MLNDYDNDFFTFFSLSLVLGKFMLVLGQETKDLSMNQAVSVNFETEIESSISSSKSRLELSSRTFKLQLPFLVRGQNFDI